MAAVVLDPAQIEPHPPRGGPRAAGQRGEVARRKRIVELVGPLLELVEGDGHTGIEQGFQGALETFAGHHRPHVSQFRPGVSEERAVGAVVHGEHPALEHVQKPVRPLRQHPLDLLPGLLCGHAAADEGREPARVANRRPRVANDASGGHPYSGSGAFGASLISFA